MFGISSRTPAAVHVKGTACLWEVLIGRLGAAETSVLISIFFVHAGYDSSVPEKKLHQVNDTLGEIRNGK